MTTDAERLAMVLAMNAADEGAILTGRMETLRLSCINLWGRLRWRRGGFRGAPDAMCAPLFTHDPYPIPPEIGALDAAIYIQRAVRERGRWPHELERAYAGIELRGGGGLEAVRLVLSLKGDFGSLTYRPTYALDAESLHALHEAVPDLVLRARQAYGLATKETT